MPLLVKDFTWTQTDNTVHIRIPMKAVRREKVDLFTTDCYVKAHFSPFFFEAFLLHDVDNGKSQCIVTDDLLTLNLCKREHIEWAALEKELSKPEKMKLRKEIQDKSIEESQQAKEDKRIKKTQLDRYTVQRAMEIDTQHHTLMDSRKAQETKNAMDALEDWRLNLNENKVNNGAIKPYQRKDNSGVEIVELEDDDPRIAEIEEEEYLRELEREKSLCKQENEDSDSDQENEDSDSDQEKKKSAVKTTKAPEKTQKKIPATEKEMYKAMLATKPDKNKKKTINIPVRSEYVEKKKEEVKKRVLPRLRNAGQVEVSHTPRTFPTPSRESHAAEEQAWLKNITLARRATGFMSEDLRPEEQDPQWCKEKGDEFFRAGNYLGAVSAYSHGITLSDKLPSLYNNRSATHFALGNFNKCMEDCSSALELLKPACEGNRRSRAKCIARRGAALARCGFLNKGIEEMKAALKLLPDDECIKKDISDMERAWEQNPDSE